MGAGRQFAPINDFTISGDPLGEGGFSKVYRAYNYVTGDVCAVKLVLLNKTLPDGSKPNKKELEKEVKVHRMLKHRSILKFIHAEAVGRDTGYVEGLYMLLELAAGGDLFDRIVPDVGLLDSDNPSGNIGLHYFTQLMSGIKFIHLKGICHRDLKPENILLDSNGLLKLSDFGLCSVYKMNGVERLLSSRCGSMPYIAPELFNGGSYKAEPIDVWGAGVVLFTMLVGNTPWDEPTQNSPEYAAYLTGEIWTISPWNRFEEGSLKDLLIGMLHPDPLRRYTIEQVMASPWFRGETGFLNAAPSYVTEVLLRNMHQSGEMEIAAPSVPIVDTLSQVRASQGGRRAPSMHYNEDDAMDEDGHETIHYPAAQGFNIEIKSQFVQTCGLMATSTMGGSVALTRELTKAFSTSHPSVIIPIVDGILRELGSNPVHRYSQPSQHDEDDVGMDDGTVGGFRGGIHYIKFQALDTRKQNMHGAFKFTFADIEMREGTAMVMRKSGGDPLEWKRLWMKIHRDPRLANYLYVKIRQ